MCLDSRSDVQDIPRSREVLLVCVHMQKPNGGEVNLEQTKLKEMKVFKNWTIRRLYIDPVK